jgi:hypothetical protein
MQQEAYQQLISALMSYVQDRFREEVMRPDWISIWEMPAEWHSIQTS